MLLWQDQRVAERQTVGSVTCLRTRVNAFHWLGLWIVVDCMRKDQSPAGGISFASGLTVIVYVKLF